MAGQQGHPRTGRRDFLKASAMAATGGVLLGGALKAVSSQPGGSPLPTIRLGQHEISRLVVGWNPIGGHSHSTPIMSQFMREYFTVDRTVELIQKCQNEGITAWQYDYTDKSLAAIRKLNEAGSTVKRICLHAERANYDAPLKQVIADTSPIAMVHHGGVTDTLFRTGKSQNIRDYLKKVHDHGLLAGVSAHHPANIKRMADEGWEADLFLTCFYDISRTEQEQEETLGTTTVGEPYLQSDPTEMTEVVRQVKQPCLGFKILAAGRSCWTKRLVEKAFEFAFANIKPIDGVIVGMFPVYQDEVHDNAMYARKYGARG